VGRGQEDRGRSPVMFTNSRFEYTTREEPYSHEAVSVDFDVEYHHQGWRRVWADVSLDGVFIVYRRERAHTEATP
jgi:hypothetical protein